MTTLRTLAFGLFFACMASCDDRGNSRGMDGGARATTDPSAGPSEDAPPASGSAGAKGQDKQDGIGPGR